MESLKSIKIIISIAIILFAGFLIAESCESYCFTCNAYNFLSEISVLGLALLIFGIWSISKLLKNDKHKQYLFRLFQLSYGILLLSFGLYVKFSSENRLLKLYGEYQEGITIGSSPTSQSILLFTSLILCFYSAAKILNS